MKPRHIVVTVAADGTVSAETHGITGPACLDYIAVLEDLLEAQTVHSGFTADYTAGTARVRAREERTDGA